MQSKPQAEHEWLQQLVGEWTYHFESDAAGTAEHMQGTEVARSVGGMWVMAESKGSIPDGSSYTNILTVGFDPSKGKYVGTFIGSSMSMLWHYEGEIDAASGSLVLRSEGPNCFDMTKIAKYEDVITFRGPDHREFSSVVVNADGTRRPVMKMLYTRVK